MTKSDLQRVLVCPKCRAALIETRRELLRCENGLCCTEFPVVNGIPILINDDVGTFRRSDYTCAPPDAARAYSRIRHGIKRYVPRITFNLSARRNFLRLASLVKAIATQPLVLIIGGAEMGAGSDVLLSDEQIEFIESDVVIGPRTEVVCDGACLPLASESVDGVVVQAVLEYMVDPQRCADEIHRVLKPDGVVYSEMPFLQGVHGGRFDFGRLTMQGHRRLFRRFGEIASGACAGPATTLAWAIQQFVLSFFTVTALRDLARFSVSFVFFWLKYCDYFLIKMPGALDAAPGTFLMARKSDRLLSDRELIVQYRGGVPSGSII